MSDLLQQFRSIDFVNYVGVEDFSDKLNFLFTATMLSAFATLTAMKTYFIDPIACFVPSPLVTSVEGQIEYVNNYCWTQGTYAVDLAEFKLDVHREDGGLSAYSDHKIVYYQWVPFFLAVQAVLFSVPRSLWHVISFDRVGTDVGHIVKVASDAAGESEGDKHDRLVSHACRMIEQMLEIKDGGEEAEKGAWCIDCRRKFWSGVNYLLPSRFVGNWLILTYLFIKLCYLGNVVFNLAIMHKFLESNSTQYGLLMGVDLLADVLKGRDWQVTMTFPRVGCCGVYYRDAGRGNWQFAQCSLPINMINEKLFIFLWFWLTFVAVVTTASIVVWIYRLSNASISNRFLKRMFRLADNYEELKKNAFANEFSKQFLRRDGTFILKMIALNCGDLICSEIIHGLWNNFRRNKKIDADVPPPAALFEIPVAGVANRGPLNRNERGRAADPHKEPLIEAPHKEPLIEAPHKEPTAPAEPDEDEAAAAARKGLQ